MTSVTFETATIGDAIRRAVKIAPGKAGHAFDKAAGLFFEINPAAEVKCLIRATNLDAFHTEIVATVAADGEATRWRLSANLMNSVVGSLPPKSGSLVRFVQDGTKLSIQSGKMRATLYLMDTDSFPDWDMFDGENLTMVGGLGSRMAAVEWAAANTGVPPLCGVYLDGEYAVATDRYRLVRVPCKFDIARPVIVPAGILGTSLKQMGDTGVRVDEHQLLLAPDDYTQLAVSIYESNYPPVDRIFSQKFEHVVEVNKAELLEKVNRANSSYAGADRNPTLRTFWGKGEIAVYMENPEMGLIGDVVEVPGQLDHKRVELKFTPKYLQDALNHCPEAKIKIHYSISEEGIKQPMVKFTGGGGVEIWIMKRQETQPTV